MLTLTCLLGLLLGTLTVLVAPAAVEASTPPGSWPQFRYGPGRAGSSPTDSLITPANVSTLAPGWSASPGGSVSSPAVVDGVVYSGSGPRLYAFDAADGDLIWETEPIGGWIGSSPAVVDGVVYAGSQDGRLNAFSAASGALLWSAETGWSIEASPVVSGGIVYISSLDGDLYAFHAAGILGCSGTPKTCVPLWTADIGGPYGTSTAAVAGSTVYVGGFDNNLYAFDATGQTGCSGTPKVCTPLWTAPTGGPIESSPAVAAGVVYVASTGLYAFDAAGATGCSGTPKVCTPLWTGAMGGAISSPAIMGGVAYIGSVDRKLYAFDAAGCSSSPAACQPLWTSIILNDLIISSPAAVGGVVFLGDDKRLLAFDADGVTGCTGAPAVCSPVWEGTTPGAVRSSPAVAGRMAYAGSDVGTLSAFAIPAGSAPSASGRYHPVPSARVVDTRNGTGGSASPLGTVDTRVVTVAGRGGVPATGVSAVALNVTATSPSAAGYLTVYPTGTARPPSSTLNFTAGQTVANSTVTALSPDGSISVFNLLGTIHLIVDIVGWYGSDGDATGAGYHPLTPGRLLDTRNGTGGVSSPAGPGATLTTAVAGRFGIPAGASAVALNVTVTSPSAAGYLTVFASGATPPVASNLNWVPGQTVANHAIAPVGPDGAIKFFNATGTTHVIVDVLGWYGAADAPGGSRYHPLEPDRIVDTRNGTGGVSTLTAGGTATAVVTGRGGVPATGVSAVALNVTATATTATGYLTVSPTGAVRPVASTLNFGPSQTVANHADATVGSDGSIDIYNAAGTTALILDVVGWFEADGA